MVFYNQIYLLVADAKRNTVPTMKRLFVQIKDCFGHHVLSLDLESGAHCIEAKACYFIDDRAYLAHLHLELWIWSLCLHIHVFFADKAIVVQLLMVMAEVFLVLA